VILLLGNTGYVGQAFGRYLDARGVKYEAAHRNAGDLSRIDDLQRLLDRVSPAFVLNAAGWPGTPNVDATETRRAVCIASNLSLPLALDQLCRARDIPFGHVSTGCLYFGNGPDDHGFRETDPPNFGFTNPTAGLYSSCKTLAEDELEHNGDAWIWRLRMPFDHRDNPRNYLTKILRYPRLLDARNSLSHLDEFVEACWACWERDLPKGIYNFTNPGSITTREIVALFKKHQIAPGRQWEFFEDESTFLQQAAKVRRALCVLDTSKAVAAGLRLRPVEEAVESAIIGMKG